MIHNLVILILNARMPVSTSILCLLPVENQLRRKEILSLLNLQIPQTSTYPNSDEIARYNVFDIARCGINQVQFVNDPFAVIKFWISNKRALPGLRSVALRVFATPVSFVSVSEFFLLTTSLSKKTEILFLHSTFRIYLLFFHPCLEFFVGR